MFKVVQIVYPLREETTLCVCNTKEEALSELRHWEGVNTSSKRSFEVKEV